MMHGQKNIKVFFYILVNCNWVVTRWQHIYTQTIHRTTQNKQYIEKHNHFGIVRAVPRLGQL